MLGAKKNIEVHLHTNDTCNLKCIHCYNNSGERSAHSIPTIDCLLRLICYFCKQYEAEIHLEGGEIFLRPELLRDMNSLSPEILQCITITTNGTIRTDDQNILNMLAKIYALRISVEGHTETLQYAVRGTSLKKVVENALFYQKMGCPVWLRLTMTKQNQEHLLDSTLPYFMAHGFSNFQIYEFQSVGRGQSIQDLLAVDATAFEDFLVGLETWKARPSKEACQLRFFFSSTRQEAVLSHEANLKADGWKVVSIPPEDGVSIHADGALYLCAWENDESHRILNVYQDGLDYMAAKLEQIDLKHICSHCSAVQIAY